MICQDFDQLFYPILNAVRISQDFEQLSISSWIHIYDVVCKKHGKLNNNTGRLVKSGETLLNVLNIKNNNNINII